MEEKPSNDPEYTWTPPSYSFSKDPTLKSSLSLAGDSSHNFARKAIWSPDGLSILAQCEDHTLQTCIVSNKDMVQLPQSGPVLDFAWYPSASSQTPSTYCFAASVRECPVKLLDATNGRLRASYSIVDHRERQVAPHSLAFSPAGDRLFCGFESAFEIFEVGRPGQDGVRVPTSPAKKSRDGIKGLISSISHAPNASMIALGSLTPAPWNVVVYDTDTNVPSLYFGLGQDRPAGVTQVMFNPMSPHVVYATFRRRIGIYAWDLRNPDSGPFSHYTNEKDAKKLTSQRHHFSIDISGRWMSMGDQEGEIHTWDLTSSDPIVTPTLTFSGHHDSVPCVSFHPWETTLLTTSGGRHFMPVDEESSGSDSDEATGVAIASERPLPMAREASLKLWDCSTAKIS